MARKPTEPQQLALFDPSPVDQSARAALDREHRHAADLVTKVPASIRFGTSSWTFPGWRGVVYSAARSNDDLAREGLREYVQHPLLRTVGVDRSYYGPVSVEDWQRYVSQVPPDFVFCTKAWERVVSPVVYLRGADNTGPSSERNPEYFSVETFEQMCLAPMRTANVRGPIMLEFPRAPVAIDPDRFARQLDLFLTETPRDRPIAVELRERRCFTEAYVQVLCKHGVAHVYNFWSAMPGIREQWRRCPIVDMPFIIVRLLLPPGKDYEAQREAFAPFDKIVAPDNTMRAEVLALLDEAARLGIPVHVLVNNKAEGSSPLTIRALAERLVSRER